MRTLLSAICFIALAGGAHAFDLQGIDAAEIKSSFIDLPAVAAAERIQEKDLNTCAGYPLTMRLSGRSVTLPDKGPWGT